MFLHVVWASYEYVAALQLPDVIVKGTVLPSVLRFATVALLVSLLRLPAVVTERTYYIYSAYIYI